MNFNQRTFLFIQRKGQNQTLKSLAEFLTTVHNQDVEIYQNAESKRKDFRESYAEDFEVIKTEVYPLFSSEDCEYISRAIQTLFRTSKIFPPAGSFKWFQWRSYFDWFGN